MSKQSDTSYNVAKVIKLFSFVSLILYLFLKITQDKVSKHFYFDVSILGCGFCIKKKILMHVKFKTI